MEVMDDNIGDVNDVTDSVDEVKDDLRIFCQSGMAIRVNGGFFK